MDYQQFTGRSHIVHHSLAGQARLILNGHLTDS